MQQINAEQSVRFSKNTSSRYNKIILSKSQWLRKKAPSIVVFFFFLRCLSSATYVLYSLYCFHHPVGGNQFGNLTKCPTPSSSWQSSSSCYYQIKNPTRSIVIFSDTWSPLLTKNIPTGSSAFEIPLGTRHSVQTHTVIPTSCGCFLGKISGLIILVLLMAHDLLVCNNYISVGSIYLLLYTFPQHHYRQTDNIIYFCIASCGSFPFEFCPSAFLTEMCKNVPLCSPQSFKIKK